MGQLKWGGKTFYPQAPKPIKSDINELMKPLSEKVDKGNVWGSIIMNVPEETSAPDVTPTPTPSITPTSTLTPTPTPTSSSIPVSPTPTPSETPCFCRTYTYGTTGVNNGIQSWRYRRCSDNVLASFAIVESAGAGTQGSVCARTDTPYLESETGPVSNTFVSEGGCCS